MKLRDEDIAYCAMAFFSGAKQKDIGGLFGLKTGASISNAITSFVAWYHPSSTAPREYPMRYKFGDYLACDHPRSGGFRDYGGDTRPFIPAALAEFVARRSGFQERPGD